MNKEWHIEATIEIRTSFFCETKKEAEEAADDYLFNLCSDLHPDCDANSYEIENVYTYDGEVEE